MYFSIDIREMHVELKFWKNSVLCKFNRHFCNIYWQICYVTRKRWKVLKYPLHLQKFCAVTISTYGFRKCNRFFFCVKMFWNPCSFRITKVRKNDINIKEFGNLSVEKKTLLNALGFELRSFDCSNPSAVESVFFSTEKFQIL